ncbi:MAG: nucleotidyltransferase family protein, partial [Candidatus Aminicenantaceae bacterium]
MSWTAEDRLLLYFCRTKVDDRIKEKIIEAERNDVDWDCFLEKTRDNGVSGVVYRSLNEMREDCPDVPSTIIEELKNDYYQNAAKNTLLFEELGKFLGALKKSELQVIVLKGAALASIVYGNLALRPMSDVDLLVKKEDLLGVDEQLRMFGYRPLDMSVNDVDFSSTYLTTLDYQRSSQNSHSFH